MSAPRVLVTGASTGIGEQIVRTLTAQGVRVVATARRLDLLERLAQETGAEPYQADITSDREVAELMAHLEASGGLTAVVNNAGGAIGLDRVEDADVDGWRRMYDLNVLGTLRVTKGALPLLRAAGGGDVVIISSTAGIDVYPGGAGYTAAKHAVRLIPQTLRVELVGEPIRLIEIAPGNVATPEFSLTRFGGDSARAESVYEGYQPLLPQDVAECVAWALGRPPHVNIDYLVVRPTAQAHSTLIARTPAAADDADTLVGSAAS